MTVSPLESFFERCQECQRRLRAIHKAIDELDRAYRQLLMTPLRSGPEDLRRVDALSDAITQDLFLCKIALDDLAQADTKDHDNGGSGDRAKESVAKQTMRQQNVFLLRNKFITAATAFERTQTANREKLRAQLRRQYQIVNPQATPQQLAEVDRIATETSTSQLDVPHVLSASTLFSHSLLHNERSVASEGLASMQARLESMRRLERSVQEVSRLMATVATLVQQQGNQLQRLYDTVHSVEDVTEETRAVTAQAVDKARKKRKATFMLAGFILALIVFVLLVVWISK